MNLQWNFSPLSRRSTGTLQLLKTLLTLFQIMLVADALRDSYLIDNGALEINSQQIQNYNL